jgi:hypothetical protein
MGNRLLFQAMITDYPFSAATFLRTKLQLKITHRPHHYSSHPLMPSHSYPKHIRSPVALNVTSSRTTKLSNHVSWIHRSQSVITFLPILSDICRTGQVMLCYAHQAKSQHTRGNAYCLVEGRMVIGRSVPRERIMCVAEHRSTLLQTVSLPKQTLMSCYTYYVTYIFTIYVTMLPVIQST